MYRFWSSTVVLIASAALLASCTGGPVPQQGLVPSARVLSDSAHYLGKSWVLPEAKKERFALHLRLDRASRRHLYLW